MLATMVLAEHMAGSLHTGWWAGPVIGFAVVVVVVAVVAACSPTPRGSVTEPGRRATPSTPPARA